MGLERESNSPSVHVKSYDSKGLGRFSCRLNK
jgi:hypothetical protein